MSTPDEDLWGFTMEPRMGIGYVWLNPGNLDHTVILSDSIHVDVSDTGEIMGVEILNLAPEIEAKP